MKLNEILAQNLRALMKRRLDLSTQVKLHQRTGLSQSTIQRVLAREVHTGLDVLATLAKAFGVEPADLLIDQSQPRKKVESTADFALSTRTVEAQILAAQFDMVPQELNPIALKQKLERAIVEWMTGTQPTPAQDQRLPVKKRSAKHPA